MPNNFASNKKEEPPNRDGSFLLAKKVLGFSGAPRRTGAHVPATASPNSSNLLSLKSCRIGILKPPKATILELKWG